MAGDNAQPNRADELPLFVWATRVIKRGDGRAELVAVSPKKDLSVAEAAQILSVQPRTVRRLWKYKVIRGGKPGAVVQQRKDGRGSNAALVLDAESVLLYREKTQRMELSL